MCVCFADPLQLTLNNYTFENVAFHALHQRFPLYSQRTLSDWFDHNTDLYRWEFSFIVMLCLTVALMCVTLWLCFLAASLSLAPSPGGGWWTTT